MSCSIAYHGKLDTDMKSYCKKEQQWDLLSKKFKVAVGIWLMSGILGATAFCLSSYEVIPALDDNINFPVMGGFLAVEIIAISCLTIWYMKKALPIAKEMDNIRKEYLDDNNSWKASYENQRNIKLEEASTLS